MRLATSLSLPTLALSFGFVLNLSFPAFAAPMAPDWLEFCPPKYIDAHYKEAHGLMNTYWRKQENYWALRHTAFANAISNCQANTTPESVSGCFLQVRQLEVSKTQQYQQQQMMELNQAQAYMSMFQHNAALYQQPKPLQYNCTSMTAGIMTDTSCHRQ